MKTAMPSVLVVDDSSKNVDLLVNTLKDEYRLGIARNGANALDYAERHHPDLILLDIMMPEMDGFEVCSRLKAIPKTKDIPVVFLTAMSETDDKTRGFEMGAVDYITKPFRPPEVKARIRAHLSLKEVREELKDQNRSLERKVTALQETLTATIQTVAAASEIDEVLNTVLNRAMMTVNARIGSIMLPDKEGQALRIAAAVGLGEYIINTTSVPMGEGISGKVAQTGESLLVEDVERDPVFSKTNDPKYETPSFICLPLRTRDQVIGVLNLSNKAGHQVFSASDLEYLNTLLTHISFAVENATLLKDAKEATEKLRHSVNEKSIQLDRAQQQVIQTAKLSTLGDLITGVTHEIENPLNVIMGYSQLLLTKVKDEEMRQDLIKIIDGSQQAARIAKNLLSFARKEAPVKRPSSVVDIVSKALEMMAYALRLNGINVVTHLPSDLPPVMVDANQMQQVFLNIVNNACQAMAGRKPPKKITLRAERREEMLRVEFADTGPGIRADRLKRIFDPFYTTQTRGKGIGLGLSISSGIVKAQHGNIFATSPEGKGATFCVELPIVQEAVEPLCG